MPTKNKQPKTTTKVAEITATIESAATSVESFRIPVTIVTPLEPVIAPIHIGDQIAVVTEFKTVAGKVHRAGEVGVVIGMARDITGTSAKVKIGSDSCWVAIGKIAKR